MDRERGEEGRREEDERKRGGAKRKYTRRGRGIAHRVMLIAALLPAGNKQESFRLQFNVI